jgi:hypothetical protein
MIYSENETEAQKALEALLNHIKDEEFIEMEDVFGNTFVSYATMREYFDLLMWFWDRYSKPDPTNNKNLL